jgi:hypothetical protein
MRPATAFAAPPLPAALATLFDPHVDFRALCGLVHICALSRARPSESEPLHSILIASAAAPRSDADFLLLRGARARASAILTSAENLRVEGGGAPSLRGPGGEALAAWRAAAQLAPPCAATLGAPSGAADG